MSLSCFLCINIETDKFGVSAPFPDSKGYNLDKIKRVVSIN